MNSIEKTQAAIIKFLMAGNSFDYKAIAEKLMEKDIAMFAQLAGLGEKPEWFRDYKRCAAEGNFVGCIKIVRAEYAIGLWEAKQIVDRQRGNYYDETRWNYLMNDVYTRMQRML